MCTCNDTPYENPSQGIGSVPTPQDSGIWHPMEDPKPQTALRNCECGCNVYSPAKTLPSNCCPYSGALRDIPVLPLTVTYEDDDAPSDDHEYVTIRATEFADMLSDLRACTCQSH